MNILAVPPIRGVLLLFLGLAFLHSGLIISFLQLCSLVLWPLHKKSYRKVNSRLAYCLWSQFVVLVDWWSGLHFTLFTEQEPAWDKIGKEHAIINSNHTFEIDLFVAWTLCDRYGLLRNCKVVAKKALLYVPVIGWLWYFTESIFCQRKWEEDQSTLVEGLKRLDDYPENLCFLFSCEGTRFTQAKHRISMRVAEAKGLPRLKYHLLPRTRGFSAMVQYFRGKDCAVYDTTLNFRKHKKPSFLGLIQRQKYEADVYFKRIPLEEIPLDEKEIAKWVHTLYQEKDALQDFYSQKGIFPGKKILPSRRPWNLLNFFFWGTIFVLSLYKLSSAVLLSGSPLLILAFLGFLGGAFVVLQYMVGITEIKKCSTYGNQ